MKINKKLTSALAGALLMTAPVAASASLIQYDLGLTVLSWPGSGNADLYQGFGKVVVDTEQSAFVSVFYDEYPVDIDWQGVAPFDFRLADPSYSEPGYVREFYEVVAPGFNFFFDTRMPLGLEPLASLDLIQSEFLMFYDFDHETEDFDSQMYPFFTNKTYLVPEPATLSLMALGLAAIGIRRRYS